MREPEIIIIGIAVILLLLFMAIVTQRFLKNRKLYRQWEAEAIEHPDRFRADDEIVYVRYKDEWLPIRRIDQITWEGMSGATKREHWLSLQRALKKGKIRKVTDELSGLPMYIATQKGRQIAHAAKEFTKFKDEEL